MSDLRKAAQDALDTWDYRKKLGMEDVAEEMEALRAALQSCPDCGKPTPPDSVHTCSPQKPDDWEGIAADQALTIGLMKVDAEKHARDAARFRWALPILTGVDSEMADNRALLIAFQLARGLDGCEAIDAAMQGDNNGTL